MKTKKATVIGGGITGIVSALYLNKKGYEVSIYEAKKNIGGIKRDADFSGDKYFNDTQYLTTKSNWMHSFFNNDFKNDLLNFNHTYSSYTDIFDNETVSNLYAMPVCEDEIILETNLNHIKKNNVIERFKVYGQKQQRSLLNYIKKFNHNNYDLHPLHIGQLLLNRIYFKNNEKKIINLKKKSKIIDELFGIPRSILFPDTEKEIIATVPHQGFNVFFDKVSSFLKKKNINIYCNSPIKPVLKDGSLDKPISLLVRNKKINFELLVWCANPVPLIRAAGIGLLDNPYLKTKSLFCKGVSKKTINNPHYIQVFSNKSSISRIYIYSLNTNQTKITIETIDDDSDNKDIITFAKYVLKKCGYDLEIIFENKYIKQKKHFLFTNNDYKKFNKMFDYAKNTNIVCGAWHINDADEKIKYILKDIDQKIS